MSTKLRSKLIIAAALVITALVIVLVFVPVGSAKKSDSPYVGMGDLRRFEAQQAAEDSGTLFSDHPYIGMGDLRYYEYLQEKGFPENADVNAP